MKVIRPTPITSAMLTASSVAEDDYLPWSGDTNYAKGALVISTVTHRIYTSAIDDNLNHDPTAAGQTQWTDMGPTNRWAMFDQVVGSVTEGVGTISVTLVAGIVDSLAILDTDADQVTVSIVVDGTEIHHETKATSLSGSIISDWYSYFFAPVGKVDVLTFLQLPISAAAVITVTIAGSDPEGEVGVGTLLVGRVIDVGSTEAGASAGITDFSKKDTDDFGFTTIVERAWSKTMQCRAILPTAQVDGIENALAQLRAKPALWIGEEGLSSLTIYGFFKDFSVDMQYPNYSYISVTIEGLT
jgi:hypothetical protein